MTATLCSTLSLHYDRNVSLARLVGANRPYIEEQIPHLSALLRPSVQEVIDEAEVIVVANAGEEFTDAVLRCRPFCLAPEGCGRLTG